MDHLIVCNTPYQVFNAINILENDISICHADCDVIIDDYFNAFKNGADIGQKLQEHNLCRCVYYSERSPLKKKSSNKIQTFLSLLQKDKEELFIFSDDTVKSTKYNSIWVGDGNPLGCYFNYINPDAEMIWYDDGILSYCGSPRNFGCTSFHGFIMKHLRLAQYRYKPGKIYVNNHEMARTKDFEICSLPELDDQNLAKKEMEYVFGYRKEECCLTDYRLIVLGQVLNSMDGYQGIEIHDLLSKCGIDSDGYVIRKHPRDKNDYTGYHIDPGANMWELECLNSITSEHILVSSCSTAQLTPKLIGKKEPYLLFLYKIILNEKSTLIRANNDAVETIRNMYSDKNKIAVPENEMELAAILRGFKNV